MLWVLLGLTVLAVGAIAFLRVKGHLSTDAAVRGIAAVVELARKAEALYSGYAGAGAEKKAWVLDQLAALGDRLDETAAGALIDGVVAWLNATGWR